MRAVAYSDGVVAAIEDVKISVTDRCVYFGDGVYDASYAVDGKMIFLSEHIDRFFESCRLVSIDPPFSKEKLTAVLRHLAQLTEGEAFVCWQLSRGAAIREHHFCETVPSLLVMLIPKSFKDLRQKYRLITMPDTRHSLCNAKTLNLLPNVLGAQKAHESGCDEVVFCSGGTVNECAHSNISILKNGNLISPAADSKVLGGITRRHLIRLAAANGINVCERHFSLNEMLSADEIIVTSSGALCMAVEKIDGITVGGKAQGLLSLLQRESIKMRDSEIKGF